ncbi:MAG: cytidine deaminase [Syntrophomonas sp.]|nr:cytidine deaminase [Syntrophomonas sp.]
MNLVDLVAMARQAQKKAYAPYSGFKVGAALLTDEGHIYTGANVENTSYGLTVCAERIAVFKAVNAGESRFQSIAIVGSGLDYIYPCGACLQVLAEFSMNIKIIAVNENDDFREYYLGEMLPQVFSLDTSSRRVI